MALLRATGESGLRVQLIDIIPLNVPHRRDAGTAEGEKAYARERMREIRANMTPQEKERALQIDLFRIDSKGLAHPPLLFRARIPVLVKCLPEVFKLLVGPLMRPCSPMGRRGQNAKMTPEKKAASAKYDRERRLKMTEEQKQARLAGKWESWKNRDEAKKEEDRARVCKNYENSKKRDKKNKK
ncbi:hypothetical protein CF319_g8159 [Tilletia indica]|nr:hypothetical protein CF319_g8159 [Tilletia indica]